MTDEYVIQTEGLTKRLGDYATVDNLSMEVRRGHVYGLLGPNGSGKTMTLGMLLGLLRPSADSFHMFGSGAVARGIRNKAVCGCYSPSPIGAAYSVRGT